MSFTRNYRSKHISSGNRHNNDKKMVYQGKQPSSHISSKRGVYPQFSEPDEYNSVTMFSSPTFKFNPNNFEQNRQGTNYGEVNDRNSILEKSVSSNTPFPTFRQYVTENIEDGREVYYDENNTPGKTWGTSKDYSNESNIWNSRKSSYKCNENFSNRETKNYEMKESKLEIPKELVGTRVRHLIGTVDQVIRWYKLVKNTEFELHYEVAGILESTIKKDGTHLMFIRSESGHILQGVFYTIDRELPDFQPGKTISATGDMIGSNKLQIFDATEISKDDFISIQRLAFLSQRSLQEALYG